MSKRIAEFTDLLERAMAGDNDAARELHASYGHFILSAVRRRLHKRLRPKFDSLDFVQDVWLSFFAGIPDKYVFNGPNDLIAFLTKVAYNKVIQASRLRFQTKKYNIEREVELDRVPQGGDSLPAAGSTPSEILMSQEEWIEFLKRQPPVYRYIFSLLREGQSSATIAEQLGISQRTVNRVLYKLVHRKPS